MKNSTWSEMGRNKREKENKQQILQRRKIFGGWIKRRGKEKRRFINWKSKDWRGCTVGGWRKESRSKARIL